MQDANTVRMHWTENIKRGIDVRAVVEARINTPVTTRWGSKRESDRK